MEIGVLALQGAFREHVRIVTRLGAAVVEVRKPEALDRLDGLVIPGGESTAMAKLMAVYGFRKPLRAAAERGMPVMGTCAGAILSSARVVDGTVEPLGLIDIEVDRNAYGRQVDSFEARLAAPMGGEPFPGVFIRAPRFLKMGNGVQVLTVLEGSNEPVAVRHENVLAMTFHPELTDDYRWHRYFLDMVRSAGRMDGVREAKR